jgi:hypothetical protein
MGSQDNKAKRMHKAHLFKGAHTYNILFFFSIALQLARMRTQLSKCLFKEVLVIDLGMFTLPLHTTMGVQVPKVVQV